MAKVKMPPKRPPGQERVNTLGMMFRMYCILYAISVHYEHCSGQNKNNVCTLFPPKTKHIIAKDVVGLLIGEIVSTKKHTSSQMMWLAYQ